VLWAPVAVLLPAALEPSAPVEYLIIVLACLALGALSDRLLAWPRAPLAPAAVAIVALVVDALAGAQLLMRSLLGPDPILGARFYGIGNELKSGARGARAGGARGRPLPGGAQRPGGAGGGRRRRRARGRRGLRSDRRGRRRRHPRQRRLRARRGDDAARCRHAQARDDRAGKARSLGWRRWR